MNGLLFNRIARLFAVRVECVCVFEKYNYTALSRPITQLFSGVFDLKQSEILMALLMWGLGGGEDKFEIEMICDCNYINYIIISLFIFCTGQWHGQGFHGRTNWTASR